MFSRKRLYSQAWWPWPKIPTTYDARAKRSKVQEQVQDHLSNLMKYYLKNIKKTENIAQW